MPGGDLSPFIGATRRPDLDIAVFIDRMRERYPWLDPALLRRYARCYGSRMAVLLGNTTQPADLGREIAPGLFEAELRYLIDHEWARTADDVLWRRTKIGLRASAAQRAAVDGWMLDNVRAARPSPGDAAVGTRSAA